MERLGKIVRDHVASWTIFDFQLAILNPISNKIIPDVNMSGSLGARLFSIVLEEDGRLIVLVHNRRVNFITLTVEEVICPAVMGHQVIRGYEFSLCGTLGIELLLGGGGYNGYFSKGSCSTGLASKVGMHGVRAVNPPLDNVCGVCFER